MEILLNAGANVHARDDGGLIPLHNACSFGHAEVRHFSPEAFRYCNVYQSGPDLGQKSGIFNTSFVASGYMIRILI